MASPPKTFPSQLQERFIIRLPDGMRDRIAEAAKASGRSMNAEIVSRLQSTFGPEPGTWARTFPYAAAAAFATPAERDAAAAEAAAAAALEARQIQARTRYEALTSLQINIESQVLGIKHHLIRLQMALDQAKHEGQGKGVIGDLSQTLLKYKNELVRASARGEQVASQVQECAQELRSLGVDI